MKLPYARLTVVKFIAYQPLVKTPENLSPESYTHNLYSDEQIWRREFKVGPEWMPLPLGWLEGQPISLIILHNNEGRFTQLIPTPEERADAMARIVEVGVGETPFTVVRPLQSRDFEPVGPINVRCRTSSAKLTITAVPA